MESDCLELEWLRVHRIQFEDAFMTYYTPVMNMPVPGLGALVDGAEGHGLTFQIALPPREFQVASSAAMQERLHRFRSVGDEIPHLHRAVHG